MRPEMGIRGVFHALGDADAAPRAARAGGGRGESRSDHEVAVILPAIVVAARAAGDGVGAAGEAAAAGRRGLAPASSAIKAGPPGAGVSVTLSKTAVAVVAVEALVVVRPALARASIVTTVGAPICVQAPGAPAASGA